MTFRAFDPFGLFFIFRQESQLMQELPDLLNCVIGQDRTLNFASHQTSSEGTGCIPSLKDIADKLESAKVEVSDYSFYGSEMAEFVEADLFEFNNRVDGLPKVVRENFPLEK